MRGLAEYIISVSSAAILCGILNSMMLKGTAKEVLKLVSGLFLAFCVINPVCNLRLPEFEEIGKEWESEANAAAQAGEAMARDAVSDSISEQLEAYILDKAESMGLGLSVQVSMKQGEYCTPESVEISGTAPVQKRRQLIGEIADALGLTEEDIVWMQQP